ncbi:hypothetical protein Dsin_027300 [Dipteronia sinensis]|uniref:Reverse transcriptase domain-containing protein n=1 Tax=Dipteronia sinensis TaxID=43782 RepID=A0AAD9ZNX9_9ROSI|nr:hypothetical protein Dsin_027300 [Dipteronia sinensis]
MSKVYDRVEWGFLRSVMAKMGFPLRWMELVHDCISTSTLGFIINGKVLGEVVPSRGLRQGCPLSPYLFLLCADSLSCLIRNSKKNGNLLGFRCSKGSPLVSHLFFADDSLLFCKATVGSCEEIGRVLNVYEKGSGQMVNLQKSNITFSPNVTQGMRANIQAMAYRVRSGYRLAMKERILEACSDPSIDQRWWTRLSNLNIPPKVKKFIWKCCYNVVHSLSNLYVRKVAGSILCQRCQKGAESVAHAVWWCDKADLVWCKTAFWGRLRRFKGLRCYEVLRDLAEGLKKEELEAVYMVMWGVWLDRNEDLHSGRCRPAAALVDWVVGLLKEFRRPEGPYSLPLWLLRLLRYGFRWM